MRTKKKPRQPPPPLVEPPDDGDWRNLLKRAIARAGSVTKLSSELNRMGGSVSRQAVYKWTGRKEGSGYYTGQPEAKHLVLLCRYMGANPEEFLLWLR